MNKRPTQFEFLAGDLDVTMPTDAQYLPAYIAAMIAIEAEHPGSIQAAFRQMALANYNFKVSSRCSNPELSMEAQRYLSEWIQNIYDSYSEDK